jgi:signal transduction histidine kinase/DNA-binding response OmpR family regulator
MATGGFLKVLLVEDDEDDYIIARELFAESKGERVALDWVKTFEEGLETVLRNQHDVCLVDYHLGARNGLELLSGAVEHGCQVPIILLTGAGEHQLDLQAMEMGAADYLVKGQLHADSFGRSIRYALQRRRAAALAAFEQARLAAFGAEIGSALACRDSLEALLGRCAQAMVQYLNAAAAQISTYDTKAKVLEPLAMAGPLCEKLEPGQWLPQVRLAPETLAAGRPFLIRNLLSQEQAVDSAWVKREGLTSFAAFPLVLEEKVVGLMSLFTEQALTEQILPEMGSVASGIALCIERKRSEEALDRSEVKVRKLAAFPQLSPNPVLEFAENGELSYANDAAYQLVKALGKDDLLSILPQEPQAIVRDCLATGHKKLGLQVSSNNRILTWSFFPINGSKVVHCYGADMTEVLNLEAQLRHAQKLESVGQLAAGVAHDFNNILTVIQGYSESLLTRRAADPAAHGALKQISLAAQRAATLTRQLLMFSRKQVMKTQAVELNGVLQNLVKMLGRLVGEDVAIENQLEEGLPTIEADTGMLEQVVMNLAVNSRDAMPKGGRLLIATSAIEIGTDYLRHNADAQPGRYVCLTVSDTGFGMDRKTLERIFEPFFTTKEVGKGSGLGLATVYGIVKQHKGWIEVESQPGQGTVFRVFFPAAAVAPVSAVTDPSHTEVRGGNETIFLVEDDPVLREFVSEVLHQYQYQVIEAGSGVEALEVWERKGADVDLLLTDIVMPHGISGRELGHQLRKRKPGLKVIYTSGYNPEMTDHQADRAAFLPKPYNPIQLAQIVRQSLDADPPNGNGRHPELAVA